MYIIKLISLEIINIKYYKHTHTHTHHHVVIILALYANYLTDNFILSYLELFE